MSLVPKFETSSAQLTDLDPNPLVILGQERQILYANSAARALIAPYNGGRVEGLKLGDLLRCLHSQEPEGCGDTPSCLFCGANLAIRLGLDGTPNMEECRITASSDKGECNLEYSIKSRPMEWNGEKAVFCALSNISHEKRRRVLERVFFHDILDTAGSVRGLSEFLLVGRQAMDAEEQAEMLRMMRDSCDVMLEEIRSQQVLLAAENGQLSTEWKQVDIADCMADAAMVASHWAVAAGRRIVPVFPAGKTMFLTDPALLGRVLRNLLKNALEASAPGEQVRLGGQLLDDRVEFSVWNGRELSPEARTQIFHRSFSTKGAGHGTGSYSVRLLTEVYLQGKVTFISSLTEGTTFTVSLPLEPAAQLPIVK
jgi:hypothetical protein